jgi:hypothetical protein
MLNICGIVAAILKMVTSRNVSIPQKFNIVRYHQNLICG